MKLSKEEMQVIVAMRAKKDFPKEGTILKTGIFKEDLYIFIGENEIDFSNFDQFMPLTEKQLEKKQKELLKKSFRLLAEKGSTIVYEALGDGGGLWNMQGGTAEQNAIFDDLTIDGEELSEDIFKYIEIKETK
jgi:hypothetical protein